MFAEKRLVGLTATEFGPAGYLPAAPAAMSSFLAGFGLRAVGGFNPVLLHDPGHDPVPRIERVLTDYVAVGADVLGSLAAGHGVTAVLHPHVGTVVETRDEVMRVLDGSTVALCLDTGHLLIGGTDPVELARDHAQRIAHTHLKDVDADLAGRVRAGGLTYTEAVRSGMYRPLGAGDVDVTGVLQHLRKGDYAGWYVLEQETVLDGEPGGDGPVADVRTSVDHLLGLLGR